LVLPLIKGSNENGHHEKESDRLVYVDDTLLFARDTTDIEAVVAGLKNLGMDLGEENDVACFLGLLVKRQDNGSIDLLQLALTSNQRVETLKKVDHCLGRDVIPGR
jgi:hypothetical protein